MQEIIEKTWRFSAAKTDAKIYDVADTEQLAVVFVLIDASADNAGPVSVQVGVGASVLPTLIVDSLVGVSGYAYTHAGVPRGGGAVGDLGGKNLVLGAAGEDLRITHSACVFIDVKIGFRIIPVPA
jgi:hypothetical protein